jgi:uncharacterized protein
MSKILPAPPIDHGEGDEPMSNPSLVPHFQDVLSARMNRRLVLKGSLGAAIAGLFGTALHGCGSSSSSNPRAGTPPTSPALLGFQAIPVSEDDVVHVPAGYSTHIMAEWGRSISNPGILYDLPFPENEGGNQQGDAIGSHHDGMHFFPSTARTPMRAVRSTACW